MEMFHNLMYLMNGLTVAKISVFQQCCFININVFITMIAVCCSYLADSCKIHVA